MINKWMKHKYCLIVPSVIVLDQLTKFLAKSHLEQPVRILSFFHLTYSENTGAGFSLLQNKNIMLIFTALIIIGILLYYFERFKNHEKPFVCLIIGGAIGNLIDRIYLGFVVDFIDFGIWPVFNIADSAITVGALGLLFLMFKKKV